MKYEWKIMDHSPYDDFIYVIWDVDHKLPGCVADSAKDTDPTRALHIIE